MNSVAGFSFYLLTIGFLTLGQSQAQEPTPECRTDIVASSRNPSTCRADDIRGHIQAGRPELGLPYNLDLCCGLKNRIEHFRYNNHCDCKASIPECNGVCGLSRSYYQGHTKDPTNVCTCCVAQGVKCVPIKVVCCDGCVFTKWYHIPEKCDCQRCSP